ncbi:MAG: nuclear transport factor 2 family protein [Pseudomonadota bacterium]
MSEDAEDRRQANLAAARRYADAWASGDFPGLMATYHDDFVLHWFGENPHARTYRGKAEAIGALMAFTRHTGRRLIGVGDVMAGPERAVILARESLTADGETREVERVLVYRVKDGLMAECWVYDEDQRFIDRALQA